MRFSASGFFHDISFPQPQSIPLGPFQIFSKIHGYIRKSRCTTSINDTGGKAAKLPPVSMTPAEILPPVSTTLAANFATSFASFVDTCGKFATSINDTGGKFANGVNDTGGK
jgi:hypothetical protein